MTTKKITLNSEKRKVIADQFQSFYEDKVKDKLIQAKEQYDLIREKAKVAIDQVDKYVTGRRGWVIDSTGREYDVIARNKNMLQQRGYDWYMVFVNTSLEAALARNARRERTIPQYITKTRWDGVQNNIGKFQRLFGMAKFIVVDNNKSDLELVTLTMNRIGKLVRRFITAPVQNYKAKQWMKKELEARKRWSLKILQT